MGKFCGENWGCPMVGGMLCIVESCCAPGGWRDSITFEGVNGG